MEKISDLEIITIKYGDSLMRNSYVFKSGSKNEFSDISFIIYLIKSGGKNILVDAGCVTMPGFEMKNYIGSVKALKRTGISPGDITDVIITHAHHDHIQCVNEFRNAVIHIQKDEYNDGKKYIDENLTTNIFESEYFVTDNIKIKKIGGHSVGSCVVEINCPDKCVVIVGDECYSHKCIAEQIPTGSSYCAEKSAEFVKKYSNSRYKLLFCHDEKIIGE